MTLSLDVKQNLWKGAVAGLVGGLVASWTMNRFQDVWFRLSENPSKPSDRQHTGEPEPQTAGNNGAEQDDTTVRTASAISEGIFITN